jgi:hypothetical protein
MPNKKRTKVASDGFDAEISTILEFLQRSRQELGDKHTSWCYDYAIIRLYQQFERFMLEAIVAAINNDTASVSEAIGVHLPKHLTDEVCEYLVVGSGYFDFKGRDGLIKLLKRHFCCEEEGHCDHYLVRIISDGQYRDAIEKVGALRNFAAHGSRKAKKATLRALKQKRIGSSGSWLKRQNRFEEIADGLKKLVEEVSEAAPR